MKTSQYIIALSAFGLIGLSACEKVIEFDAEVKEPKLVANSWFTQDSTWKVHLSRSLSVIDNGDLNSVENGTVRILDGNGALIETLTATEYGFYEGTQMPTAGASYRVEASASGYTSVTGSDFLPQPVAITNIDTLRQGNGLEGDMEIKITIQDPPGENFYLLRLRSYEDWGGNGNGMYVYPDYMTNDPAFESVGDENYYRWGPIRDALFDGQTYTFTITVDSYLFDPVSHDELQVVLYSTSEAGYNYRRSYELYKQADGNPFAQPVQVYSNVDEGFGCFAGYSPFTWTIQF